MRRSLALVLLGWTLACGGGAPPAQLTVVTDADGLSPEEVEAHVVLPQEQALRSLEGLAGITATATAGEATLALELAPGTDVDAVTTQVQEALSALALPEGVAPARVMSTEPTGHAVRIWLLGEDLAPLQRDAERIANEASYWPGVTQVHSSLQLTPALDVEVDVAAAERYGLTAAEIGEALGPIDPERPEDALRTVVGMTRGRPVRLSEVAELSMRAVPKERHRRDGQQAVVLSIFGAERAEVARQVQDESLSVGVRLVVED